MSSITVSSPWWKTALPDWAPELGANEFYALVGALRSHPFGHRLDEAGKIRETDLLIKYCVWAEAVGLEKDIAGKVVRLFKLVKSHDQFQERLPERFRPRGRTLGLLQELGDSPELFDLVRSSLVPKRVSVLSEDQKAGLNRLQIFEVERVRINADFDRQERILMDELRKVRNSKDAFNSELKTIVPEWKRVLDARKARLTMREKEEALQLYEENSSYKERFTPEGFLLSVRQNKITREEHTIYRTFRVGMSEPSIREAVQRAVPATTAQASQEANHHTLDPGILPDV